MRKNTINENFFDVIDTQEKAYVLGLFYADACNMGFRTTLSLCDVELVEKICAAMGVNKDSINIFHPKIKTRNTIYTVNLFSKHMCEQLTKHGCGRRKSLVLTFPSQEIVPEHLLRHFVRGYFDGDGSIFFQSVKNIYKYRSVSIMGTPMFLEHLKTKMPFDSTLRIRPNNKAAELKISGKDAVNWLREWFYENSVIHLDRKREKFFDNETLIDPTAIRYKKERTKKVTQEHLDIISSYQTGLSTRQVAKLFGKSKSTVHAIIQRNLS